jgi:deazaflavin-dependent oxidoreductase (nitroreductase family)
MAAGPHSQATPETRYVMPTTRAGRTMGRVFNAIVAMLTSVGISVMDSRVLYVRGRKSGEWRTTPVNLLTFEGRRYLVAPRGHTQWVRNMRAAGGGELHVGRRVEKFTAREVADQQKPDLLRAYLRRWKFEVGVFFGGVGPDAPDEKLLEIAPGYPVFVITVAPGRSNESGVTLVPNMAPTSRVRSAGGLRRWHLAAVRALLGRGAPR